MEMIFLGLILLVILAIGTALVWQKINYNWLQNTTKYLIWSLPFEWFPRIDIAGAGFRLSQALVLVAFWFLTILSVKKDPELLQQEFSKLGYFLPIFLVLSSPSWLNIQNSNRFFVHFFGTVLCFGASFLIASFETKIYERLKELSLVIFGVSVFGFYQYLGDLAGLPSYLTGLREQYTKIVFGVPRIQGLAIEPLYFAGMLCIPIIFWITKICFDLLDSSSPDSAFDPITIKSQEASLTNNHKIEQLNILQSVQKFIQSDALINNICKLAFVTLIFILTLSKGNFGVLVLILILFFVFAIIYFQRFRDILKRYGLMTFILVFWLISGLSNSVDPVTLTGEIGKNFVETIAGTSASASERNKFLGEAILHIPEKGLQGIGMGQYGQYVGDDLGGLNAGDQAIVNNVYVEVFLEEGLLALIWFLFILVFPLWKLVIKIKRVNRHPQLDWGSHNFTDKQNIQIASTSLFFVLLGYYLQWNLFSPIFIMPIFILLGLAYSLVESKVDQN